MGFRYIQIIWHFIWALTFAGISAGCSHVSISKVIRGSDPRNLLLQACKPGGQIKSAQGSAWLKGNVQNSLGNHHSAQFPAEVVVQAPSTLYLEAHNLLGGVEARISVEGQIFKLETPDRGKTIEKRRGSWGGIPLEWATDLFLGKIPCPSASSLAHARLSLSPEGQLWVQILDPSKGETQKFIYSFGIWQEKPWAEQLHWEKQGVSIDFKFFDPEEMTGSPMRWEAKSSQGEIQMRWKDRDYELTR